MIDQPLKNLRILVVDDEKLILELYKNILTARKDEKATISEIKELSENLFGNNHGKAGPRHFDLVTCQQGSLAVEAVKDSIAQNRPFAVAFLDVRMPPGQDGVWTAERIRELDPNIEIVIVTAHSDINPSDIALKVPPSHKLLYIQKPFHAHEIIQFASSLGAKWQMENRLQSINLDLEKRVEERTNELAFLNEKLKKDIDKRKITEKALGESEERYRDLFENAHDMIQSVSPEGKFLFVNQSWLKTLGFSKIALSDLTVFDIIDPGSLAHCQKLFAKLMDGEPIYNLETVFQTSDGGSVLVEGNVVPRFENNKIVATHGFFRDITSRREAEKAKEKLQIQLLQAQKMEAVGVLAGGIAHDFNNILQTISGFAQLILMDTHENDPNFQSISEINEATQKANMLTRQLLTFGRKIKSDLQPTDLNNKIIQMKSILECTLPKMVAIELSLADDLKSVIADQNQLDQMLMNLSINASHAMPDGGNLIFETKNVLLDEDYYKLHLGAKPGECVLLTISDTGYGMDQQILERIFEPFFSTKETGKGTGLGLAMVHGIVKSHGAHIMCYSEPEHGTIFKIYFPVLSSKEKTSPKHLSKDKNLIGGDETILIVDDDDAVLKIGKNLLERFGYKTLTVQSGEKAIEAYKAQKDKIDLVILDLNMPGMGGQQCLKELLPIDPDIKVIISSGYSFNETIKKTIESGARGFISKPYQLKDMVEKVRQVLNGSRDE
jgi:PAS domain S-box-containing protein